MSRDLNKVQMTGRLGADPEGRYTADGAFVVSFRVASNRTWKDRNGTAHEETEWFRVVAWDKLGEICNQYLTKGARVYVEGRLKTRKYTDRDGVERSTTEVIASDLIILSSKRGTPADDEPAEDDESDVRAPEGTPAPTSAPTPAPASPPAAPGEPAHVGATGRAHPAPVN